MKNETNNICIVNTVYTLFLYFLICGYNENDFFIFSDGIPIDIRNNIPHYFFPKITIDFSISMKDPNFLREMIIRTIELMKYLYEIMKLRAILFSKTKNKEIKVYGHGHLNFSFPIYECENNAIIEDGLGNYINLEIPQEPKYFRRLMHFMGFYTKFKDGFGTHKNIKKIYLTQDNIPKIIKNKVEVINLDLLWHSHSLNEQKKILKVFNLNFNIINENSILLLTEPFYESDELPFDEEIAIYKEYINKYPSLIIKPHPREQKDYKKIFPNITVIDSSFPIEMLKYTGTNISKIITICSTAALNFKDYCEIEIYDKKTSSNNVNKACSLLKNKLDE